MVQVKPLNFGSHQILVAILIMVEIQIKVGFYLTPKGRQFDNISDPLALAEVCTLRVLLV